MSSNLSINKAVTEKLHFDAMLLLLNETTWFPSCIEEVEEDEGGKEEELCQSLGILIYKNNYSCQKRKGNLIIHFNCHLKPRPYLARPMPVTETIQIKIPRQVQINTENILRLESYSPNNKPEKKQGHKL